MKFEQYNAVINADILNHTYVGQLMGEAINDKEITPDQYEILCRMAKKKGFKFGKSLVVVPV